MWFTWVPILIMFELLFKDGCKRWVVLEIVRVSLL